jgi:putative DNA primase/helicase
VADQDLQAALEYYRWGLIPLPCAPGTKHPLVKWEPYQGIKKVTEEDIRSWFSTAERRGIWLLQGPQSGTIVVDLDTVDSVAWFRRLCPDLDFNAIPRVKSSKGWHLYFGWVEGAAHWHYDGTYIGQKLNMDIRNGDKGGVMAPPSIHESGHVYAWEVPPMPGADGRPAWVPLPPQMHTKVTAGLAASAEHGGSGGTSTGRSQLADLLNNPPEEGGRNVWLTAVAGHYAKMHRNKRDLYDVEFNRAIEIVPGLTTEEVEKTRESVWRKEANKPESEVRPAPEDIPELASPNDPTRVARQLVERQWTKDGQIILHNWREDFYIWVGDRWIPQPGNAIRAAVRTATEHAMFMEEQKDHSWLPKPWLPNNNKLANVVSALEDNTVVPPQTHPPAWVGKEGLSDLVPLRNGLLHYPTRRLQPPDSAFFNLVASPFDYDPATPAPEGWLGFLDQLWEGNTAAVELLQEWFGLSLTADVKYEKILLLTGPKRAGKGTIIRVLTELVGPDNVASPTASSFAQNFGLMPLIGKSMAIVPDARIAGRDAVALVERLLSISAGDQLTIDRKNRSQWTGTLGARLVVVSNEFPRLPDASGALANRYLPLQLTRSWLGHEDKGLSARLLGELPGILNWALDGLDRLTARGRFVLPADSEQAILDLEDLSSPVLAFIRDWCVVGTGHEIEKGRLYGKYAQWCNANGYRNSPSTVFGRDLGTVLPELSSAQRTIDHKRQWVYVGLDLTKDAKETHEVARPVQTTLN